MFEIFSSYGENFFQKKIWHKLLQIVGMYTWFNGHRNPTILKELYCLSVYFQKNGSSSVWANLKFLVEWIIGTMSVQFFLPIGAYKESWVSAILAETIDEIHVCQTQCEIHYIEILFDSRNFYRHWDYRNSSLNLKWYVYMK